ncbi:MAG: nucleoid-associated protein [Lachnospiraceae bacterium]|nr:nucleoid-associated protein [Lachnospiraceae bacterium]MBD5514990.1 nucleoid-associated protein [Lachnospiraceae bacterium]MDE6737773.1 nucleoid-associated protein [Lachnospiraceae bacterium]
MNKEEIRIKNVIVHILDSTIGMPVLSDTELEYGSEVAEFLKEHIARISSGDDAKECRFYKEESEVYHLLNAYADEDFVSVSKDIATQLYEIMNSNIDIPAADLMVVRFKEGEDEYLALLKMNYKSLYTHRTMATEDGEGNSNEIIRHKSILPSETQRLTEAAIIRLQDLALWVIEKKYEVNGEKTNYFSFLFLKCSAHLSHKSKLSIVSRAVESVQKEGYDETERFEKQMRAKSIIQEEIEEKGGFVVEELAERIFEEQPELKVAFQDKMEKYDMVKEEIQPQSENTVRKYQSQHLYTDTGIEIKIPMEQYKNPRSVEFITNPDGTISVLIKNIEHLEAKL